MDRPDLEDTTTVLHKTLDMAVALATIMVGTTTDRLREGTTAAAVAADIPKSRTEVPILRASLYLCWAYEAYNRMVRRRRSAAAATTAISASTQKIGSGYGNSASRWYVLDS